MITDWLNHRSEELRPLEAKRKICFEVFAELNSADSIFAPFHSAHEGLSIIEEELEELRTHVYTNQKRRDLDGMRHEAIQLAAMAVKFVHSVCDAGRGRV